MEHAACQPDLKDFFRTRPHSTCGLPVTSQRYKSSNSLRLYMPYAFSRSSPLLLSSTSSYSIRARSLCRKSCFQEEEGGVDEILRCLRPSHKCLGTRFMIKSCFDTFSFSCWGAFMAFIVWACIRAATLEIPEKVRARESPSQTPWWSMSDSLSEHGSTNKEGTERI